MAKEPNDDHSLVRWQHIFEHSEWGIVIGSADGQTLETMNPAFARMHGYTVAELAGRPIAEVFAPDCQAVLAENIRLAHERGHHVWESWHVRRDGTRFPVQIDVTAVKDEAGKVIYRVANVQDITDMKRHEEELLRSRQLLRELAAHREQIREEERARIAREVHDQLGQYLTALRMDAALLNLSFGADNPELAARVEGMKQTIDTTIGVVRDVATALRPAVLDMGLVSAAEWLLAGFEERSGVLCDLESPAEERLGLDDARATAAFRILQESITNIGRHAMANRVRVSIERAGNSLSMMIADDGTGFDPEVVRERKTFGLMGIRERALIFGGEVRIDSRPGAGTSVSIRIPLKQEPQ
ncbi:MAG: PAS domain-containing sensor histidine kinase [Rhodocyclaceae bacterium]|nr:PAS domain-containing sensor histidine kinase [Rhodocyclaceae bacterium]